jgi:hypothetical protein
MGSEALRHGFRVVTIWESDVDVGILEPKARVNIGCNFVICFDDVLNVRVHKVVEGIDVLFHESFDF